MKNQLLASLGYVVVMIDGVGSFRRGQPLLTNFNNFKFNQLNVLSHDLFDFDYRFCEQD
jgi:hypothetical protein